MQTYDCALPFSGRSSGPSLRIVFPVTRQLNFLFSAHISFITLCCSRAHFDIPRTRTFSSFYSVTRIRCAGNYCTLHKPKRMFVRCCTDDRSSVFGYPLHLEKLKFAFNGVVQARYHVYLPCVFTEERAFSRRSSHSFAHVTLVFRRLFGPSGTRDTTARAIYFIFIEFSWRLSAALSRFDDRETGGR